MMQSYLSMSSCDKDHKALQLGLNALQDWSNKWLLKLNILKCKAVFFGRNINKNYTYSLHGTQLERPDYVAYSTQLRAISDAASSHDISSRPAECRTSYIIVGLYL